MFAYKNLSLKKLGFNQLEVYIVSSMAARVFLFYFGSYNTKLGHNPNFLSVVRYSHFPLEVTLVSVWLPYLEPSLVQGGRQFLSGPVSLCTIYLF